MRTVVFPFFRSATPIPSQHRANFRHLYFDIAWFGVLLASAVSFVTVYASRQGADAFQMGLLSASPAVINLALTLPAGRWLEKRPIDAALFWGAALNRFFYVLWIPLPWLFGAEAQIWVLIALTLLMSIPGTVLALSFNALFADIVPPEWRGHVVGVRNALQAVTFIAVSLLCSWILARVPFPTGYQIVFGIGFLGAAMSTVHLGSLSPNLNAATRPRVGRALGDLASPGRFRLALDGLRPAAGLRYLIHRKSHSLKPKVLTGPFGKVVAVVLVFYIAVQLSIPVLPLYWVNDLQLTDQNIGLGTALFYASVFIGSTQLPRLVRRMGNHRVTVAGAIIMSLYPGLMALAQGLELFLVASAVGGMGWSLVGGALTNYILDNIPEDQRPAYLAWYNLTINAALLVGSLLGPLVAELTGLALALGIFAALRLVTALAILRWG